MMNQALLFQLVILTSYKSGCFLLHIHLIAETVRKIPDLENVSEGKEIELSRTPVELKSDDWIFKVVPWIGGRIISLEHIPSGNA